jgi:membrane protease YdiL (CAAX protease family)
MLIVVNVLVAAILLCGVAAWSLIGTKLRKRETILPYEPREPVPWEFTDLLIFVFIFFVVGQACLATAIAWSGIPLPKKGEEPSAKLQLVLLECNATAGALTLVAGMLILRLRRRATWGDLGFDLSRIWYDLCCGSVAFVAAAPIVYAIQAIIVQWIPYTHPLIQAIADKPDAYTLWVVTMSAVVVAPLAEEFFFRGILQGWFEKLEMSRLSPATGAAAINVPTDDTTAALSSTTNFSSQNDSISLVSDSADCGGAIETIAEPTGAAQTGAFGLPLGAAPILVSSLLFALVHWGQGAAPIALFAFALMLGFLYRQTHRLWPSITCHALLNAVTMLGLLAGEKP